MYLIRQAAPDTFPKGEGFLIRQAAPDTARAGRPWLCPPAEGCAAALLRIMQRRTGKDPEAGK